jgi:CheY-like chemotaxis protein
VDDIDTNLIVSRGLMTPYRMIITLCKSGKDAIYEIAVKKYDLVFMDHMMPEMDGVETVARIRYLGIGDDYYKNVPIIALTANAVSGTKEMFLQNGFNDFLSKPIDTVKLNTLLTKWIPKEKQKKLSAAKKHGEGADFFIPGINVKKGAESAGGIENYKKALQAFLKEGYKKTGLLKTSLKTENMSEHIAYINELGNAAAEIGADDLLNIAIRFEAAGNQGDIAYIQDHSPELIASLKTHLHKIRAALYENEETNKAENDEE